MAKNRAEGTESKADHLKHLRATGQMKRKEQMYIPPEGKITAKIMGTNKQTNKRGRKGNKNLIKKEIILSTGCLSDQMNGRVSYL